MESQMRHFLRPQFLFVRVNDVNTAVSTVSQKFMEASFCAINRISQMGLIIQIQVKQNKKTPTLIDLLKKISTRDVDSTGSGFWAIFWELIPNFRPIPVLVFSTKKTIVFKNGRRECDR
jgi:hypothetical protein